jgi:hypothetical protein
MAVDDLWRPIPRSDFAIGNSAFEICMFFFSPSDSRALYNGIVLGNTRLGARFS